MKLSPKSDPLLPPSVLAAGTSVLQQLIEDTGLFQRPEVGDVLRDNGNALAAICLVASTVVAVGQRTQQGVVLVSGKVIPEERGDTRR